MGRLRARWGVQIKKVRETMSVRSPQKAVRLLWVGVLVAVVVALGLLNPMASLAVVRQAPPGGVYLVSRYDGGSSAHSVVVQGNYAYVGFDQNFTILDLVANVYAPIYVGSVNLNGQAEGIAV